MASSAALQVQTGVFDPVLGRTYREIAIEGRNQHKTQETGAIEPLGPASSALHLNASLVAGRESSLFDGIDTRLTGIAGIAGLPEGALRPELQAIDAPTRQAIDGYRPLSTERIVPALVASLRAVRTARAAARAVEAPPEAKTEADFLLAIKEEQLNDAVARAASVVVDPLSDVEMVTSGSSIIVALRYVPGRLLAGEGCEVKCHGSSGLAGRRYRKRRAVCLHNPPRAVRSPRTKRDTA